MHTTENPDRLMTVCNACRYYEGLCAVFPAMEMCRSALNGNFFRLMSVMVVVFGPAALF